MNGVGASSAVAIGSGSAATISASGTSNSRRVGYSRTLCGINGYSLYIIYSVLIVSISFEGLDLPFFVNSPFSFDIPLSRLTKASRAVITSDKSATLCFSFKLWP